MHLPEEYPVEFFAAGLVLPLAAWRAGSFRRRARSTNSTLLPSGFRGKVFLLFYRYSRNKIAAPQFVGRVHLPPNYSASTCGYIGRAILSSTCLQSSLRDLCEIRMLQRPPSVSWVTWAGSSALISVICPQDRSTDLPRWRVRRQESDATIRYLLPAAVLTTSLRRSMRTGVLCMAHSPRNACWVTLILLAT